MTRPSAQAPTVGGAPTSRLLLYVLAVLLLGWGLIPPELGAQAAPASAGSAQMRHFWHVFAAYAVAWGLILVWIVSIVRRLKRLEDRLPGG